jgi:hypothetical protein
MGKSRIDKLVIDPAGSTNMTGTNLLTGYVNMAVLDNLTFEPIWTGTPTGTFAVADSDSYDPVSNPGATFNTVTPSPALVNPTGAAGQGIYAITKRGKWVRWQYTNSSSTGSLSVRAFGVGTI